MAQGMKDKTSLIRFEIFRRLDIYIKLARIQNVPIPKKITLTQKLSKTIFNLAISICINTFIRAQIGSTKNSNTR